jgi:hypothetical protein
MHPYLDILRLRLIAFGWSEWVRFCETFAETEPLSNIVPTTMSTSGLNKIVSSGHGWTICATMTEQTNSQQPQTPHQIRYNCTNMDGSYYKCINLPCDRSTFWFSSTVLQLSIQPEIVVQVDHGHDSGWICGWSPSLDQRFFLTPDRVVVNVLRTFSIQFTSVTTVTTTHSIYTHWGNIPMWPVYGLDIWKLPIPVVRM